MAGRHAPRSCLDEETENIETIFLCQRRQDIDSVLLSHVSIGIELLRRVKRNISIVTEMFSVASRPATAALALNSRQRRDDLGCTHHAENKDHRRVEHERRLEAKERRMLAGLVWPSDENEKDRDGYQSDADDQVHVLPPSVRDAASGRRYCHAPACA